MLLQMLESAYYSKKKKSCSQNGYRKPRPHVSVAARLRGMALPASVVVRDVMSERNPPNIKQNMGDMLVE